MRTLARVMLTACVLGSGVLVSACDTLENFEIWETKKKLPGERKPVFPEGVPGVTQGVPPEYLPGYQDPSAQATAPAQPGQQPGQPAQSASAEPAAAAGEGAAPAQAEKPKPKPKRAAAKPPAQAQQAQQAQPVETAQPQQPQPTQPPYGQTTAWPSAPPPGTFSR